MNRIFLRGAVPQTAAFNKNRGLDNRPHKECENNVNKRRDIIIAYFASNSNRMYSASTDRIKNKLMITLIDPL